MFAIVKSTDDEVAIQVDCWCRCCVKEACEW